jgi:hypothetical protein
MRKFTPEEEAILRGELPVTIDYRAVDATAMQDDPG